MGGKETMKGRLPERTREKSNEAARSRGESLVEFFRNSPLVGADIDWERQEDKGRDVNLSIRTTLRKSSG
jgi:hypothetical protein